jgi:hypothetical protein
VNKLLLIVFSVLLSCSFTKNTPKAEVELIITLQRTACFGTCPIYKIEIYSDGSGTYTGTRFVENIGITEFNLSETNLNLILSQAEAIGFSNMKDEYSEPISDLPTTFIQIKNKKIKDYVGAPKTLKNLEKLIDQIYLQTITN